MKYLPPHEQDKKLVKTPLSWVRNVRIINERSLFYADSSHP